jgi:hypothetical protein
MVILAGLIAAMVGGLLALQFAEADTHGWCAEAGGVYVDGVCLGGVRVIEP